MKEQLPVVAEVGSAVGAGFTTRVDVRLLDISKPQRPEDQPRLIRNRTRFERVTVAVVERLFNCISTFGLRLGRIDDVWIRAGIDPDVEMDANPGNTVAVIVV